MSDYLTRINEEVARYADDIIEWTQCLVRIPSENRPPHGAEAAAADFVAQQCTELGLEVDQFRPDEVEGITSHESFLSTRIYDAGRRNVVARWAGGGQGKSILFGGHTDVAPYEPDDWQVCRPYEPVIKEGRLYGRGSADMKSGLTAAFWAIKILREIGFEPGGDIIFETVVDEEFASGNGTLASRLRGYNTDLAILAEPTQMQLCPACLGAILFDLTIKGRAGMPYIGSEISNPVNGAARVIEHLRQLEKQWQQQYTHPLFDRPLEQPRTLVWKIDSTRPGEFTQMGTPLQVILSCIIWCYPGTTEQQVRQRFEESLEPLCKTDTVLKDLEVDVTPTYHFVKPWETNLGEPLRHALEKTYESGRMPVITGAPYSCDLGIYGQAGIPAILLGPRCDNLHAPDEWVNVEDILELTTIYARLAVHWCNTKTN
jgi:acetylornithine deacetylase